MINKMHIIRQYSQIMYIRIRNIPIVNEYTFLTKIFFNYIVLVLLNIIKMMVFV